MPPSAALLGIVVVAAFLSGAALDTVLRSVPAVDRRLPPGRLAPITAGATGLASALAAGVLTARGGSAAALVALTFVAVVGAYLSAIDLRHRLLPNVVVVPSIAVGGALFLTAGIVDGRPEEGVRALAGALALFGLYLVLALVSPGGLGMGDVKFAALIGAMLAWRGWQELLLGAAAGFALVALVGALLLVLRRARRGSAVPFAPMMLAGAVLVLGLAP